MILKKYRPVSEEDRVSAIRALALVGLDGNKILNATYNKWKKPRPVLCVETKQIFQTAHQAGKKYGCVSSNINQAILRKGTCRGFHWKYKI